MESRIKLSWLLLILWIPLSLFSQRDECKFSLKQEVKVMEANDVTYKGESIEKGQLLVLQQEIPLRIDQTFFACNNLEISEGGKLQFYDKNKKAIRLLRYVDSQNSNRTFQSERTSNSVSRNDENSSLNYCDESGILNSEFHVSNLLSSQVHICDFDCFKIYFGHPTYYQLTSETLSFEPNDLYIKGLLFETSEGQEFRFLKKDNKIFIDSDLLPEEDEIRLFLIALDGSSSLLGTYDYVNLGKIINRLSAKNHSPNIIENEIRQIYLHSLESELTDAKIKNGLQNRLKEAIVENQKLHDK